jgi:hypothetical protein
MPLFHAIRRLWNDWLDGERSAAKVRRSDDRAFPRLYGIRLEERQLLDAAPLVQLTAGGLLTVGAGAGANDGQADQFSITESHDDSGSRIDVQVNGQAAGSFDKSLVSQIRVVGSSDADTLVLDPIASPDNGILFEGAGNPAAVSDQLILQSPVIDSLPTPVLVQHGMAADGGAITIIAGTDNLGFVEYVGVEQVTDRLAVESRSFQLEEGLSARLVGEGESGESHLMGSTGISIDFATPLQSLSVTALGPSTSGSTGQSPTDVDSEVARLRVEGDLAIAGGQLNFDAGEGGLLEVTGRLSTTDTRAQATGGTIHLLGDRVYVRDGAQVDASGDAGGGEILVGGGQAGADPLVRNAQYTWLESGATLSANALGNGSGGRVIVWADVMAAVHGDISAMGGVGGGDGGFVETSGLVDLVVWNAPNVSSPQGEAGVWLIDPLSITIVAGTTNTAVTTTSPFTPTGAGAQLSIDTLRTALGGGSSVVIQTASGTGTGDITLDTNLNLNGLNGASLTLNAHNDIILNGSISDSSLASVDRVDLTFNSDSDNSGSGVIRLNNATLSSGGGSITFLDNVILGANVTIDSRTGAGAGRDITFSGAVSADNSAANSRQLVVNAGGANVTFNGVIGSTSTSVLADLDVTAATINLAANVNVNDSNNQNVTLTGDVVLLANVQITTVSGANANDLQVTGSLRGASGYTTRLDIFAGTGDVKFDANVDQLGLFRIRSAGAVSLQSVTTGGVISGINHTIHVGADSAVASLVLRGDLRTNGLAGDTSGIRLNSASAIQLDALSTTAGSILLQTDGNTTTDGAVVFVGTTTISSNTSGLDGLRINVGSNSLDLSNMTLNTLDHLVVSTAAAQTVALGAHSLGDGGGNSNTALSVSSGTVELEGDITALGNVLLTGTVKLLGTIDIVTSGATVTGDVQIIGLTRADDSTTQNRTLVVNAGVHDVTFDGDIGANSPGSLAGLTVTAATITLGGAKVVVDDTSTTAATIALNGAVLLTNSVAFDLNGTTAADNNLRINGSINADNSVAFDRTLSIDVGSGTVELLGAVGQSANGALADLDITANSIQLSGDIRVDDGAIDPAVATITFDGAVTLKANVSIDVDADSAVDNNVTFVQTVSGDAISNNRRLTIDAGGGDVVFSQAVDQLALFRINSADSVELANVTVHDDLFASTIHLGANSALGSLTLRGALRTDGTADAGDIRINVNGDVTLDAAGASAGTILFDTDSTGVDGAVVFASATTVTSAVANQDGWTLVIGANSMDLSTVTTSDLDHLTITAAATETIRLGVLSLDDGAATGQVALTVTAGIVEIDGDITTNSGAIQLNGDVVLVNDVVLNTTNAGTGGDIEVTGVIQADDSSSADRKLEMNAGAGEIRLKDSVGTGATGALAGLVLTAATIRLQGAEIIVNDPGASSSTILFAGDVELQASVSINVDTTAGPFANNLTFTGSIDADDSTAFNRTLSIVAGAGTVTLGGPVGQLKKGALADLDITAANIELGGDIRVDDATTSPTAETITFNGKVALTADVEIDVDATSGLDKNITFFQSVSGDLVANARQLSIVAGGGDVEFRQTVDNLAAFRIDSADEVQLASVTVHGNTVANTIDLGAVSALGSLTLLGDLRTDGAADAGNIRLNVSGDVSLDAAGASAGTIRFDTDATGIDGTVLFAAAATVTSSTANQDGWTLEVGDSSLDLTSVSTVNLDHLVITAGSTSVVKLRDLDLGDGDATAQVALEVTAGTVELSGDITTDSGVVRFDGDVVLTGDVTVDTTNAGTGADITATGVIRADDASTADRTLEMNAGTSTIRLEDSVGTGTDGALAGLQLTASTIELAGAEILVNDPASTPSTILFAGAVKLEADVTITSDSGAGTGADITFTSTVDADAFGNRRQLTVVAGDGRVTFNDAVGSIESLSTLDVTAAEVVLHDNIVVEDAGGLGVSFDGAVILQADITIDANGAAVDNLVRFLGSVDGGGGVGRRLIVDAGTATASLQGNVGGNSPLADLDITAANILLGASITVEAAGGNGVTFNGDVSLTGNVSIDTDRASSPDYSVTFGGLVDADNATANNRSLTINAGTAFVDFLGEIGTKSAGSLHFLDVTANEIRLQGRVIADDAGGATTFFRGDVVLLGNVSIDVERTGVATDNNIVFEEEIRADDSTAFDRQLTITAGTGIVTFRKVIGAGSTGHLAGLDVTASTVNLADSVFVDDGPGGALIALRSDVVLNGNVTIDTAASTTANNLLIAGTVQGDSAANNRQFSIVAGAGDVRLDGAASVLSLFRIDSADDVVLSGVQTRGRVSPTTISLGQVVSLGSLTLKGDLRTDAGTDAGDIFIATTGAISLDAPGSGTITFDTDAVGIDGNVVLSAGLNVVSATPFQDGLTIRVGARDVDLRTAVLSGLDHLIVQTDSAHDVILGSLSLGDGAGSGGLGALSVTARTAVLTANIQTNSDPTQVGGAVRFDANVRLEANVDIQTQAIASSGNVTILGAVNADNATANDRVLRILADGAAVSLANVGDGANGGLSQLIVRAGTTTLTGSQINVNDANAATRQLDFQQGNVLLANTMTMTLGASAVPGDQIRFAGQLNSNGLANHELTLNATGGQIFFFGSVGASPSGALAQLNATAAEIVVAAPVVNLSAGGGKTSVLNGLTVLTNNVQFILDNSSAVDNSLVFAGIVRADSSVIQSRILIIQAGNGSVIFEQDMGGGVNGSLAGLSVSANTIVFRGPFVNVDDATSGQLVLLAGNVVVANNGLTFNLDTSGVDNSLRITGTVNADDSSNSSRRLTIQAGGGSVTLDGSVGNNANGALADFDVFANTLVLGGSLIRVDDAGGDGFITISSAVRLANDVTIDTDLASGVDYSVVFEGAVNADNSTTQNRRLEVQAGTAVVNFVSDIGVGTNGALAELDLSASTIRLFASTVRIDDGGNRESNWTGTVQLFTPVTTLDLDGTAAIDNHLTINNAVVADDSATFDRELIVLGGNGTVSLLGGVGAVGGGELAGLSVQAGLYRLGGQFIVDDGGGRSIEIRGNGQLVADVVFDIDGAVDNSLTFFGATASIDSDSVATPRRLTMIADQGNIAFEAAVGNNTPLAGFDVVSAQNLTLARVSTMGNSGVNTIHLGSGSPISGQLVLTGDLRTNQGAAAGGIRIQASGPAIIEAAGVGTAGSIRLDTDLAASTLDGAITFVGGANFQSANPFEDGLTISSGSRSVDLANATLLQLDHLRVVTASDQTVTLGSVSVGDGAGSGVGAAIDVSTGVTRLRGNLLTNNETTGGAVVLRSAVELGGSIDILTNTNGLDGRLEILGNVRADDQSAFDRDLEVNTGDAETWLRGDVGSGSQGALAGLSVTAGVIRLAGQNILVNDATTGTTVLMAGDVTLENNVLFQTDAAAGIDNDLTFTRNVKADNALLNNRRLQIEAGGGTVRFLSTVGVGGSLADLDVAANTTQLSGNLQLDDQGGNTITFQGAVQLFGDIAIDVAGPPDNHLEFVGPLSTIDGDAATNSRGLSITAGQGNVTLGGAIGANQRLGQLTIVSANNVLVERAIQATGVRQLAGTGDSTFRGAVTTSGPTGISLANSGLIEMQADVTATGGGSVQFTQGRALRLAGNVFADGGFLENGAGLVTLTAGKSIATTGDTLEFQSDLQLSGGGGIIQLDTTQGGQPAGNNITLRGSVNATTAAPNAESLTLNAGTAGNIVVEGTLGATTTLGVLRINSAADVTFEDNITVAGFLQTNGQAGKTTRFQANVTTTSNLGLLLDTDGAIELDGDLNNTGGGGVEFRNGGQLRFAGDIDSNGDLRQSGTGVVAFVGGRSIVTSGQLVEMVGPVELRPGLTGGAPELSISTTGGKILFWSSIDSLTPGSLTLDAGGSGDVELRGAIGGTNALRDVVVVNANDLLVASTLRAGRFEQQGGTGTTSLLGVIESLGSGGIEVLTAGDLIVNRLRANGDVPLTLTAGDDISIGANGEVFVTGNANSTTLVIDAGGDLLIDPTARLRVGTGANQAVSSGVRPVITVTPVADPFGVSVNEQGETTVRLQIGNAGSEEQNVDLRIDWEKGQFSPAPGETMSPDFTGGGRVYTFNYQYNGNPSPNPTDPIPILVSAAFDPRIQLFSQGGAVLGAVQQTVLLQPPNGGLFGFNVVVPVEDAIPRREPSRPIEIVIVSPPTPVPIAQRFDPGSSPTATTVERTREVQLRVVTLNSQGMPEDSDEFIALDESELNNLPELFQSLPDNRYRIYLRTENGSRRMIRDVVIRNRKVVELDESTGNMETEQGVLASPDGTQPNDPAAAETLPTQPTSPNGGQGSNSETTPAPSGELQLNRATRSEGRSKASQDLESVDSEGRTPALSAALVAAGSLYTHAPREGATDWNQRARRALRVSVGRLRVNLKDADSLH